MINGEQIRAARETRGLTQSELAQLVGVSMRTVGNWERGESVPRTREARLRTILSIEGGASDIGGLSSATDAELLAEIAKRFARDGLESGSSSARQGADRVLKFERKGRLPDEAESPTDYNHLAADAGEDGISPDQLPEEP